MPSRRELDEVLAAEVLKRSGLADGAVRAERLGGGVSSVVVRVRTSDAAFVLKQPRERFAVRDEWKVSTRRAAVEARVGRWLAARLGDEAVARVRAFDERDEVLVLDAMPEAWSSWKDRLLAGEVRAETAAAAGRLLARIHLLSEGLGPDEWREDGLFHEQRIDPYFGTAAERVPEARPMLDGLVRAFFARSDLVHGDFSPKNLFVSRDGRSVRLIDHEVVTRGDAAFDLGFLLTHLAMKAIHLPRANGFVEAGERFLRAYAAHLPAVAADPGAARQARAVRYLGGLLLARVVGKSPAEYLDARGREGVASLGLRLLRDPPPTWDAVWKGPAC